MTSAARTGATDPAGPSLRTTARDHRAIPIPATASPASDRQAEYRTLMRKWWFGAAVGAPTMLLSYPWLIPGLRDLFPRSSDQLWWLWVAMGVASLAVIVYSRLQEVPS